MKTYTYLLILLFLVISSATPVGAAPAELVVTSPQSGVRLSGSMIEVVFEVSNFTIVPTPVPVSEAGQRPEVNRPNEGHVHLMLDLMPLVVWEQAAPYTFADVPAGEHVLTVELVNNDHASLSPPVVIQRTIYTEGAAETPQATSAPAGSGDPHQHPSMPNTGMGETLMERQRIMVALIGTALIGGGMVLRRRRSYS